MTKTDPIIIAHHLDMIGQAAYSDYLSHAICTGGSCTFSFNGREFTLCQGDVMIVHQGKLVEHIAPESGFQVTNVMVAAELIAASTDHNPNRQKQQ